MANQQDSQFISLLKTNGERVTSPRLAIFRVLSQHSPLPMNRLRAKAGTYGIDSVTVYRTLILFKHLGLVQEIGVGNRRLLELTGDFSDHHHHFWCSHCGKMLDFYDDAIDQAMTNTAKNLGFTMESHQLEIVGRCKECSPDLAT